MSAWSDESFQEKDSAGFYIIAAAVIEPQMLDDAREAMLAQRGRRTTAKAHWTEMDQRERKQVAKTVACLGAFMSSRSVPPFPAGSRSGPEASV
ncbi:hypothetical protein [Streptomyces asiaticus]|uniref:hypothetical protein n=1 Tax=Streptomyces asiaticus TaxID=114695 RepID=UPI003F67001D